MSARENLFYSWKNGEDFDDRGQSLGAISERVYDTAKVEIKHAAGDEKEIEGAVIKAINRIMEAAWLEGFDYALKILTDK